MNSMLPTWESTAGHVPAIIPGSAIFPLQLFSMSVTFTQNVYT